MDGWMDGSMTQVNWLYIYSYIYTYIYIYMPLFRLGFCYCFAFGLDFSFSFLFLCGSRHIGVINLKITWPQLLWHYSLYDYVGYFGYSKGWFTHTHWHSLWPGNCINSAPSGVGVYRLHRKDAISIFDLSCAPNCRVMWATFSLPITMTIWWVLVYLPYEY